MDRESAILRLKQQRRGSNVSEHTSNSPKTTVNDAAHHSAAQSHQENDAYMQRFEEAFAQLGGASGK